MSEYTQVHLPHNFTPREYQVPMLQAREKGFLREVYVLHRRAGKDLTAWNDVIRAAAVERVGFYPYFFPTFAQAKKVIWDGMTGAGRKFLDYIPLELVADGTKGTKKINNTEMKVEFKNGSILQMIGTDNFEALKGTNCVGAVFSEYALQDPRAWEKVVEPILGENKGWAKFLYTPNGKNHGFYLWEYAKKKADWFTLMLNIEQTKKPDGDPVITLDYINDLRERGVDEELIQQEYYCSFSMGTAGAYYARHMEKARQDDRIKKIPFDTALPVHTFWDIGVSDFTSIIFAQILPGEYHIIDFYENHGEGVQHYAKVLQDKGYTYGNHYGPHDLKAKVWAADGKPQMQVAKEHGIVFQIVPKLSLQDGIETTRNLISKTYFDEEKSKILIHHLDNYSKKWNDTMKVWTKTPRDDEHTHGADAMRYMAVSQKTSVVYDPRAQALTNEVDYEYLKRKCDKFSGLS